MKKHKNFRKILIILAILFLTLLILLFISFKAWTFLEKKEIKMIPIIDRCSILFSNILHNIKDESGCENSCRSECLTRDMNFYDSEFSFNQESCNTCNCYCK